jgi:hypothetical protein
MTVSGGAPDRSAGALNKMSGLDYSGKFDRFTQK